MSEIFTLEKIYRAYQDCKRRKKNTISALKFEIDRERNLIALLQELKSKRYEISKHICFIVTEPTPREIFAADFRDRVVHHLLYSELKDLFEVDFIDNSFANREGKGTHKGVEKLKEYLKEVPHDSYFLKMDIKSFFRSINKDILFSLTSRKIESAQKSSGWKREILWLTRKIIYHDPTRSYIYRGSQELRMLIPKEKSLFYANGKGLPIGNLTSQFFANIYLNELDKFIYSLGFKYYIRYVDDFIILGEKKILGAVPKIRQFLKDRLDLEISDKKTRFDQINKGIDFLGYYIKPNYVLVRRKIVHRFKDKLHRYYGTLKDLLPIVNSYLGHFRHADAFSLRKIIYQKYFTKSFVFRKEYNSLRIK